MPGSPMYATSILLARRQIVGNSARNFKLSCSSVSLLTSTRRTAGHKPRNAVRLLIKSAMRLASTSTPPIATGAWAAKLALNVWTMLLLFPRRMCAKNGFSSEKAIRDRMSFEARSMWSLWKIRFWDSSKHFKSTSNVMMQAPTRASACRCDARRPKQAITAFGISREMSHTQAIAAIPGSLVPMRSMETNKNWLKSHVDVSFIRRQHVPMSARPTTSIVSIQKSTEKKISRHGGQASGKRRVRKLIASKLGSISTMATKAREASRNFSRPTVLKTSMPAPCRTKCMPKASAQRHPTQTIRRS
mmetsp:Transcript_70141/g.195125  ORF Transcript_70141/g.195125 Transcript_70141/m.195125 type:complete len:303 (-) Transcript_70141:298-1206(-)